MISEEKTKKLETDCGRGEKIKEKSRNKLLLEIKEECSFLSQ
jgi:hypothetical protein